MNSKTAKTPPKERDSGGIPFDEALRRLVNAPPQHKPGKKKPTPSKGGTTKRKER